MVEAVSGAVAFNVSVSLSVYSVEALKRAAYVLMPRAMVTFEVSNLEAKCTITPNSLKELEETLRRDFHREIVDQDLRISIEAQTEQTRTAILGLTFSKTGLQG